MLLELKLNVLEEKWSRLVFHDLLILTCLYMISPLSPSTHTHAHTVAVFAVIMAPLDAWTVDFALTRQACRNSIVYYLIILALSSASSEAGIIFCQHKYGTCTYTYYHIMHACIYCINSAYALIWYAWMRCEWYTQCTHMHTRKHTAASEGGANVFEVTYFKGIEISIILIFL